MELEMQYYVAISRISNPVDVTLFTPAVLSAVWWAISVLRKLIEKRSLIRN